MDENNTNTYMLLVCGVGFPIAACSPSGYTLHATMMNMHVQCDRIHTCYRGYSRACSHVLDPQACILCMYVVNLGKEHQGVCSAHTHTCCRKRATTFSHPPFPHHHLVLYWGWRIHYMQCGVGKCMCVSVQCV
jgi:hypothetical protein